MGCTREALRHLGCEAQRRLSQREVEAAALWARGVSHRDAAAELGVSPGRLRALHGRIAAKVREGARA